MSWCIGLSEHIILFSALFAHFHVIVYWLDFVYQLCCFIHPQLVVNKPFPSTLDISYHFTSLFLLWPHSTNKPFNSHRLPSELSLFAPTEERCLNKQVTNAELYIFEWIFIWDSLLISSITFFLSSFRWHKPPSKNRLHNSNI